MRDAPVFRRSPVRRPMITIAFLSARFFQRGSFAATHRACGAISDPEENLRLLNRTVSLDSCSIGRLGVPRAGDRVFQSTPWSTHAFSPSKAPCCSFFLLGAAASCARDGPVNWST